MVLEETAGEAWVFVRRGEACERAVVAAKDVDDAVLERGGGGSGGGGEGEVGELLPAGGWGVAPCVAEVAAGNFAVFCFEGGTAEEVEGVVVGGGDGEDAWGGGKRGEFAPARGFAVEAGGEDAGGSGLFAWRFGSAGDEGILVRVDGTGGECERDGERARVDVGVDEFSVAP